jgi:hypothetical protein
MGIKVNPKRIVRVMALIVLTLLALSLCAYASRFYLGYNSKLITFFSVGYEKNLPTYYSSMSLLFCAILLMVPAMNVLKNREKYGVRWAALSAIFIFLSLDEMLEIHENLIRPFRTLFHTKGMLRFAWVLPYGFLLIIFLLMYVRFWTDLPKKVRTLFAASGAIYVLGAMGMELLGSRYYDAHGGGDSFIYVMHQTVEESLEMFGIVLFAYAIAVYIRDHIKNVTVEFE